MPHRATPIDRSHPRLFRAVVLAATLTVVATGCGYRAERPFPSGIQTVAVEIFSSREFRRGLELQVTEAVAKRIEAETPYKLARRDSADTLLTGEVKEVRQGTLGRTFSANVPRETTATLVVAFQWKDLRNGRILVDRPNFVQTVEYVRPLDEDFYHASQRLADRMAEKIVEQMEADW
ncbi:MAG: LPS assembly lipoprotein LptE [Phycisphaerae bacterium]